VPVDLHTHSTASDGTESPQRVTELAAAAGLRAFALTDHDTLSGLATAGCAAEAVGIELVPGVELSVDHGGVKIHMLAYFIEAGPGPLQDELAALRDGRNARNPKIVEKLTGLGFPLTMAEVEAQSSGETVGRPHIAAALVERGYIADNAEAFDRWIGDNGPAYVERDRLTALQANWPERDSTGSRPCTRAIPRKRARASPTSQHRSTSWLRAVPISMVPASRVSQSAAVAVTSPFPTPRSTNCATVDPETAAARICALIPGGCRV
jgi:hypothetical protein